MRPLPVKPVSVPPTTVTSEAVKSLLVSLRMKVMVAVSPGASVVLLLVMAIVGGVVSAGGRLTARLRVLSASAPSWLKTPPALNLLLSTLRIALCAPALGVNVAV